MQKNKNFLKKAVCKIQTLFNDGGKFSLSKSLILILLLSVWTILFQVIALNFNILQFHLPVLLFNVIPVFLVMCLLYFITGKISASYVITNILLFVLLIVNHFKVKFRDEPLRAADFSLGKEAENIIQNYDLSLDPIICIMILFCAVSFWFVIKKTKNKRPNLIYSLTGIVVTLVLAFTANSLIYSNPAIYNKLLSSMGMFQESKIVSSKGLIYSLLNDMNITEYHVPEGYSRENAENILSKYKEPATPENVPNVIAVMCEAYSDIQQWENVNFVSENPYNYFNYLKTKGCYGKIFVPGFAGATATTEFEFLTGNNTSAISTTMPTAYKTLITDDTNSIVRIFKNLGFEAKAMHPGFPWFYNRQNVYLRMGFDSFTSKDDLESDAPNINTYVFDSVAADMIINDFDRHLQENPENGYFNFLVTIQNHGPYDVNKLSYGQEYISRDADLTDQEYYTINNYLGGIKSADEFMQTIYEYINSLDEPTVFIIFGDHLPYLDQEEKIYEKLGLDIVSDTYEAYENRYSTDYVIIGNDAYLNSNVPSINGQQELISSNYLSVKLLQYMNMELPPFHQFLNEMMQYAPILSKQHNGTSEGFTDTPDSNIETTLKDYKILQYYNIKDYQVINKTEMP